MCSLCGAGRSDWGRFRKFGTLELVPLEKAEESGPNNQRMLIFALKTSRAKLLVKICCPRSAPERKVLGS